MVGQFIADCQNPSTGRLPEPEHRSTGQSAWSIGASFLTLCPISENKSVEIGIATLC